MRWRAPIVLFALLAVLVPVAAFAQSASDEADSREVLAYRLTMPRLRQLNQAGLDAAKGRDADPKYRGLAQKKQEYKALQEQADLTDADQARMDLLEREISEADDGVDADDPNTKSLRDMAREIESNPQLSTALRKAGVPAREAAVMMMALFQAGFTASMLESGAIKQIPKTVNADNVKFYQANKAELESLEGLSQEAH
ncbi:MAG: hypothetical protein ABI587_10000 [Gemmatimonadales bacterium]